MAEERNRRRFRIGAGDINPVVRLETTGALETQYAGKAVDLTGLTIKAVHYDGTKETVTDKVLLSRHTWGITAGEQKLEVGYKNIRLHFTVDVEAVELDKIEVTTPPAETEFAEGADIDLTGMVVTATYTDGTTKEVTDYTFAPEVMASDTTEVTISYTEGEITKTATQAVTLKTEEE